VAGARVTFQTASGEGRVLQDAGTGAGGAVFVAQKGFVKFAPGATYRITTRARTTVSGSLNYHTVYLATFDSNGAYNGAPSKNTVATTTGDGWVTHTTEWTAAELTTYFAGVTYLRAIVLPNPGTGTRQLSQMLLENVTESKAAAASAAAASGSAASASGSAASALTYMNLSASLGGAAFNTNPFFADFPTTPGQPTGWTADPQNATGNRVTNPAGGYGYQLSGPAGSPCYVARAIPSGVFTNGQYVVVEMDARLDSGALTGAGFLFVVAGGTSLVVNQPFSTLPDMSDGSASPAAVGAGTVGRTYRFRKLIQITNTAPTSASIYVMAHYTPLGSIASANQVTFWRALVRAATPDEIAAGLVLPDVKSTVTTLAGSVATMEGKTAAWLEEEVNAGSSAAAFLALKAESAPGVEYSSVALGAKEVHILNSVNGQYKKALSVVGGQSIFYGGLQAPFILLGSGGGWPAAYASKDFPVADGTPIDYGTTFNSVPDISFSTVGLDKLNAGEVYSLYVDNPTTSGCIVRLKIIVPTGSPTIREVTGDVTGGTYGFDASGRCMDVTAYTAPADGVFHVTVTASELFDVSYDVGYNDTIELDVFKRVGGVWSQVGSVSLNMYGTVYGGYGQPTISGTESFNMGAGVTQIGVRVGSGGYITGSQAFIDSIDSVKWTQAGSASGTRSATPSGQTTTMTVRPKS
jgi:hypothetical protein